MRNVLYKAVSVLRAGWLGLAGQGLTFLAMFAPLVWARFDQLAYLLVCSAGATVLAYAVTLAFSSLFPRLTTQGEMITSLRTSLGALCTCCLMLCAAAAAMGFAGMRLWSTVAGCAALTLSQGLYLMATGLAVRHAQYQHISVGRLIYGALLASLTIAACIFGGARASLVVATCIAYACGSAYIAGRLRHEVTQLILARPPVVPRRAAGDDRGVQPAPVEIPSWKSYLRTSGEAGLSQALNGLASQLSVLILPGLGAFHDAWTAILRLTGGFGTVATQLVAPALDISLSTELRNGRPARAIGVLRREIITGASLGLAAVALSAVLFVATPALRDLSTMQTTVLVACMVVYCTAVLAIAPMFNSLILLGGDRPRLLWAAAKSLGMIAVLLLGGSNKLVGSVLVETVFAALYAGIVFRLAIRLHQTSQSPSPELIGP